MKTRFQKAADAFYNAFERRLRDTGEAFYCLADNSPEWMTDAIYAAHDNGDRLPDDYIYNACHSAVCHIVDTCDGEEEDETDKAHEFADSFVSVYNGERAAWLAMHLGNAELVDDAISEGLASLEDGIYAAIGAGMYIQAEQIFMAIHSAIEDAADDMPAPYVAGWNMPGYMPEMEGSEFDSFDDAKQFIIDELKSLEELAGEDADNAREEGDNAGADSLEETATEYCHAAEDVNMWSSPNTIQAGAYAFWIADNEQ